MSKGGMQGEENDIVHACNRALVGLDIHMRAA